MAAETHLTGEAEPQSETRVSSRLMGAFVSDAAIVGGITVIGYLITYAYLIGRATTLGIPESFVSVSPEMALLVVLSLILGSLFLVSTLNFVMSAIPKSAIESVVIRNLLLLSLLVAVLTVVGIFVARLLLLFLIVPALLCAYFAVMPFFEAMDGRTYYQRMRDKMLSNAAAARKVRNDNWLDSRLGAKVSWWLFIPLVGISLGQQLGVAEAQFTTTYFVQANDRSEVLLARFGDMLIFRKLGSRRISIKVIGKDEIPELVLAKTGSMALQQLPEN